MRRVPRSSVVCAGRGARFMQNCRMRVWLLCALLGLASPCWAAYFYAQFGDVKYPPGFPHFDYVNPRAPKGGEITLVPPTRLSSFDKYNPFTLKGLAAPGLPDLMFDTLLTGDMDEPTTAYGLLADDVTVAPDGLSAVFTIDPRARFSNGDPVLASDVKYSFDKLTGPEASPQYQSYFGEVAKATVEGKYRVRFDFRAANRELPLIVGSLPVFSPKWGGGKPLDQIVTDPPIASGPYRIGHVDFGRDISYERDPHYWAKDLNVRRGLFNFDRVTYKLYQDNTAQLEAFKAGEFDYIQAFIAREWARAYTGRAFDSGRVVKREFRNGNPGDFQGFLFNTRRDKFKDWRVRRAIGLAMDFEWLNRELFFNAYTRVRGYFPASDFEAKGLPGADELALLDPLRAELPAKLFTQPVPQPPVTNPDPKADNTLRDHLREAQALLNAAGWTYRDGALRNAAGEPLTIEFLDNSGSMGRVVTPYAHNLARLGIRATYRVVDFAILQKRMNVFDYDVISNRVPGSTAPGTELLDRFGSKAAGTDGSSNFCGIADPAVDALLKEVTSARTRPELIASLRALDRVLRFGYYMVPHWYSSVFRVAFRAGRFERPNVVPRYYQPDGWVTTVWWASPANLAGAP